MSEFLCSEGHIVFPSIGYCELCREFGLSGKIVSMDGMTERELREEEREEKESERWNMNGG